jgi:hypothetical protein
MFTPKQSQGFRGKMISHFIEKLNPQYQVKFKRLRCHEIEELQEAIANFDKERREIFLIERSKAEVNLISYFKSGDEATPRAEQRDDLADIVA